MSVPNLLLSLFFALFLFATTAEAASYKINAVTVEGSTRIAEDWLAEVGLMPGKSLTDDELLAIERRINASGLFQKVLISLSPAEKGVNVVVSLTDDADVAGQHALGFGLKPKIIYADHAGISAFAADFSIVGRSLYNQKFAASADMDAKGVVRRANAAVTTADFEPISGHVSLSARLYDPTHRFQDGYGFGGEYEVFWTKATWPNWHLGYAYWGQDFDRFEHPFFPRRLGGPTVLFRSEQRQLAFVPTPGLAYSAQLVLGTVANSTAFKTTVANTAQLVNDLWLTVESGFLYTDGGENALRLALKLERALKLVDEPLRQATKIFATAGFGRDEGQRAKTQAFNYSVGIDYRTEAFVTQMAFYYFTKPETDLL